MKYNGLRTFDRGLDFYNMIDSFFNDDYSQNRAIMNSSFKVDVEECNDKFVVYAELAGFKKEEIDIDFENGRLTLSANHSDEINKEDKNFVHKERRMTNMKRAMYFKDVKSEEISASLNDGILVVNIPKRDKESNKKKITID